MRQNTKELLASWRKQTGIIPIPLSQRESRLPISALGAAFAPRPTSQTTAPDSDPREIRESSRQPQANQPQTGAKPVPPALARRLAAYRNNARS